MALTWDDISVAKYVELMNTKPEDFESNEDYLVNRISIIYDKSVEEIEDMFCEDFNVLIKETAFTYYTIPKKFPVPELEPIAGVKLHLLDDLYKITVGEYIDLENYFTTDYIQNLRLILAILYRQKIVKNSPLFPDEFEKYGNYIFHRERLFNEIPINSVYGVINKYKSFRTELMQHYEGLYSVDETFEEQPEETEELSFRDKAEKMKAEKLEKAKNKWAWDEFLYVLAKQNRMTIEQVTEMPLIYALNLKSMIMELNIQDTI